jgi:hypothetical protein
MKVFQTLFIIGSFVASSAFAQTPDVAVTNSEYSRSLTLDFAERDRLPQTDVPVDQWEPTENEPWGPAARTYPEVLPPIGHDVGLWRRDRIIEVAQKYVGLPYLHRHIPAAGGLDCSNFTSWVYNYGLGIRFVSQIVRQSETVGRKLAAEEPLKKGDLLFIWSPVRTRIVHVAIYLDPETLIDSSSPNGVKVRRFRGWYKDRYAWARRVL